MSEFEGMRGRTAQYKTELRDEWAERNATATVKLGSDVVSYGFQTVKPLERREDPKALANFTL